MQRHPVQSSVLQSAGYDESTKILELEFREGGTYEYFNLSLRMYQKFIDAESKGKFFVKNIKGKYHELKIK